MLGVRQLINFTTDAEMKVYLTNSQKDHGITAQSAYALAQSQK